MKLNDWIKQIGKTANEICNNPDCNRIKLKTSDNGQHRDFIIESNDAGALAAWVRLSKDNLDGILFYLNQHFGKFYRILELKKNIWKDHNGKSI